MMKKRNSYLDMLKYVCAIGVIFLHTLNLGDSNSLNKVCFGFKQIFYYSLGFLPVVEIFFITSSFLLFSKFRVSGGKICIDSKIVRKYLSHLVTLYLSWAILYFPIITQNWQGRSMIHNFASLLRNILFGYALQMWYIPSTIIGTIMIMFCLKHFGEKGAWCFAVLTYIFGLISSTYYYLFQNPITDLWLKVFVSVSYIRAPIYIMLGYFLAKKDEEIINKKNQIQKVFLAWLLFGGFRVAEMYLTSLLKTGLNADVGLFKQMSAFFLVWFVILINQKYPIRNYKITGSLQALGMMSSVMYFCHVLIIHYLEQCFNLSPMVLFALTVLLSSVISYIIYSFKTTALIKCLI